MERNILLNIHEFETLERVPIGSLKPWPDNPRIHTRRQIAKIAQSIRRFGQTAPIIIDENNQILAGHGRLAAAKEAGFKTIECKRIAHLSEREKRAYVIADNRLTDESRFDPERLRRQIDIILEEPDFDITVTGLDAVEIDGLINVELEVEAASGREDTIPHPPPAPVSQAGDLWICGRHRLLCADALKAASYKTLMGGEKARQVVSDPPYNLQIDSIVNTGKIKHDEFEMASGEMTRAEFTAFLTTAFGHCAANSVDGSIHYYFMDWRHQREILDAGEAIYDELKNVAVWDKGVAGLGSFYRQGYELIFIFKRGRAPHQNNFALGQHGRTRSNLWRYRGVAAGGADAREMLEKHPTSKAARMIADAMRDCSSPGEIVLDPFAGSGTVLIAAEMTSRRARAIEISPTYVDRSVMRWEAFARDDALHAETGRSFRQTAEDRGVTLAAPKLRTKRGRR